MIDDLKVSLFSSEVSEDLGEILLVVGAAFCLSDPALRAYQLVDG
jgi:hypothetical protein